MINIFKNIFFLIKILELQRKFIPLNFLLILNLIFEILTLSLVIPFIFFMLKPGALENFANNNIVEKIFSILTISDKNFILENIGLFLMISVIFVVILRVTVGMFSAWKFASFGVIIESLLFKKFLNFHSIYELKDENKKQDFLTTFFTRIPKAGGSIIYLSNLLIEFLIFITILVYIFFFYLGEFFAILFLILISFSLIFFITLKRAKRYGELSTINLQKKTNILKGYIDGLREIFIYSAGGIFFQISKKFNFEMLDKKKKMQIINSIPRFVLELIFFIILSVFLFLNFNNNSAEQFANLTVLGVLLIRIMPSINRISVNYNQLKISDESISYIVNKIKRYLSNLSFENVENLKDFIEMKDVSFEYKEKKVFENLNLKFHKNQSYLIFGESGSGKSTLVDLLIGYSKTSNGQILIDNQKLKAHNSSWIEKISYVPQMSIIFDGSIRFNITFKKDEEEIDEKFFNEILKLTNLNEFVLSLPKKELTQVNEFGANISGGQRQRISLARALYKKVNILIMDEATNAVDKIIEEKILRGIVNQKNKLVIMISHNKLHFDLCDNVYEIQNKKIIKTK